MRALPPQHEPAVEVALARGIAHREGRELEQAQTQVREPVAGALLVLVADERRVHAILEESGWADIELYPIDVACTLLETELVRYLTRLGPVGRALEEVDARTRAEVAEVVRAAFEPFVHGGEVRFNAACWMIGARS